MAWHFTKGNAMESANKLPRDLILDAVYVADKTGVGGVAGVTAQHVVDATMRPMNVVTAALTHLTNLGCVHREKRADENGRRVWHYHFLRPFTRDLADAYAHRMKKKREALEATAPASKSEPLQTQLPLAPVKVDSLPNGAALVLKVGSAGECVSIPFEHARAVHLQLEQLFGGQK